MGYITASNREEAIGIGRALVADRLVACINVLGGMHSIYWWEGRLEEAEECVLIVKTSQDQVKAVIERVKDLHAYTCPCIVFWPLSAGNPDYLGWIEKESGGSIR